MTDALRHGGGRPRRDAAANRPGTDGTSSPPASGAVRPAGPPDRRVFVLDSEAWTALSSLLELPVRDVAGLRALLANATVLS